MQIYQQMNHDLNIYKSVNAKLPAGRGKKKIKNTNIRKGGHNNPLEQIAKLIDPVHHDDSI
jgi:hypothetical protein